jgi:uncharacterized protein (DUF1919 family)
MRLVYSKIYDRLKLSNELDSHFTIISNDCNDQQLALIRSLLLPKFEQKDILQAIETINKMIDNLPTNQKLILYSAEGATPIKKIQLC